MLSLCCLRSSPIALASAVPWHRRVNRQEPLDLATLWLVASGWMPVYSWLVHDPDESFWPRRKKQRVQDMKNKWHSMNALNTHAYSWASQNATSPQTNA